MYNTHAKNCQQFAQSNPDNLVLVILMVSLSIKQPWHKVGIMIQDVLLNGSTSRFFNWKMKLDTYQYSEVNKHYLHASMLTIINDSTTSNIKAFNLMQLFLKIPGLNISKAGFVCQLTAGLVGCMDSHNIKHYNINPTTLDYNKKVKGKRGLNSNRVKLENYINVCHSIGTQRLWDTWCNMIASRYDVWNSGDHVSEVHYTYLTGE